MYRMGLYKKGQRPVIKRYDNISLEEAMNEIFKFAKEHDAYGKVVVIPDKSNEAFKTFYINNNYFLLLNLDKIETLMK